MYRHDKNYREHLNIHDGIKEIHMWVQGLSVPFACVGSGDPVRVLRLYTMNTLDTL